MNVCRGNVQENFDRNIKFSNFRIHQAEAKLKTQAIAHYSLISQLHRIQKQDQQF